MRSAMCFGTMQTKVNQSPIHVCTFSRNRIYMRCSAIHTWFCHFQQQQHTQHIYYIKSNESFQIYDSVFFFALLLSWEPFATDGWIETEIRATNTNTANCRTIHFSRKFYSYSFFFFQRDKRRKKNSHMQEKW